MTGSMKRLAPVLMGAFGLVFASTQVKATTITFGGQSVAGEGIVSTVSGSTAIATFGTGSVATATGATLVQGSVLNHYKSPVGVTGKYWSTGTGTATLTFLRPLTYFGLYWGSVDPWNTITFWDGSHSTSYTGSQIAKLAGFTIDGTASEYVNFFASAGTEWTKIQLSSSQPSFEFANLAYIDPVAVPEPASLFSLAAGLGLLGLGLLRRKR